MYVIEKNRSVSQPFFRSYSGLSSFENGALQLPFDPSDAAAVGKLNRPRIHHFSGAIGRKVSLALVITSHSKHLS